MLNEMEGHVVPPMLASLYGTMILNDVEGHVIPQNSRKARSLLDSAKWIAAEHEEMHCIAQDKVLGRTSPFFPEGRCDYG